jgi:predicted ATPase/DNA-binding SARP family transcriptional activator
MDFGVLGPLRVDGPDGEIALPAAKQRALLATLLLAHREEAVSPARLIDVLWGEDPPATAAKALQVLVSRLRRALGGDHVIVTRASGYAVALEPGGLDLARFESLAAQARGAEPREAARLLREALALFRGPPLADVPLLGPAASEPERLADLRLAALEDRIDADLAIGGHHAVIAELEALTAEHPYRERLHAQLMRALYRDGRQADALDAYRRVRTALVEDLGLDPGRELQELEAAILAHDPALDLTAAPAEPPPLPAPLTPLLGREAEVEAAAGLLGRPGVRLVTITGPGGIGKTRVALELAGRLSERFADGARFIPLAAIDAAARVVPAIAQALGVVERDQGAAAALAASLAGRELLLVLDNLEQVLDAAPELAALLAAAPGVKLLATSRAPLRIAGERELAISPLAREPAVELFVSRAQAVGARLGSGPEELARVARICDRLDRLPLAIELAAARAKLLSPAAILERLEHRLDLLSAGSRDAPARQQTLRATIGWSYDLLDPGARALFAQLGVFVGGWTLEAAEAVCGPHTLDGLATLLDHSLVTTSGERFGMLETVREYALERLREDGAEREARRRHARAFADFASRAEEGLMSPAIGVWLDRLDADLENLRSAIGFAAAEGDAGTALALFGSWRYWTTRGNLAQGRALATMALATGEGPPELRLRTLNSAGVLAGEQGDFAAARELFEESIELAERHDVPASLAGTSMNLGSLALYEGDFAEAVRRYEQGAAYWRAEGDVRWLSVATQNLGLAHGGAGEHERAIELLGESVELAREAGDPAHLASTLRSLSRALLLASRAPAEALEPLREGLALSAELDERPGIAESLETLAAVVEPETGAELIGAAEAAREAAGAARQPDEEAWVVEVKARLRDALGEAEYERAVRAGAVVELTTAIERGVPS